MFGTMNTFTTQEDLSFAYKMAFEAMSSVEYRTKGVFSSPIIHTLKTLHHQDRRIQITDFQHIEPTSFYCMLKHKWIFDDWSDIDIYKALLNSIKSFKNKTKERKYIAIIVAIVCRLIEMGHTLGPFNITKLECTKERIETISQQILLVKSAFIGEEDIIASYERYMRYFNTNQQHLVRDDKGLIEDLGVMGELLNITMCQDEREYMLQKLWIATTEYKRAMTKALHASNLDEMQLWDKHITAMIAECLCARDA